MRIVPLQDRLLIKLSEADRSQYKGALVIPDSAKSRVRVFEVVDKGPDAHLYEIGDKVIISFYTGVYIDIYHNIEPENLRLVSQEEVLGKLVED